MHTSSLGDVVMHTSSLGFCGHAHLFFFFDLFSCFSSLVAVSHLPCRLPLLCPVWSVRNFYMVISTKSCTGQSRAIKLNAQAYTQETGKGVRKVSA